MELKPMRVFGVSHHDYLEIVPTPMGECCWCDELIKEDEIGFVMSQFAEVETDCYWHRECFLRSVLGSVAHQQKRCSCYGGVEEDDEKLSKRQAAIAAVYEFERNELERSKRKGRNLKWIY